MPTRQKNDKQTPYWFSAGGSWQRQGDVPWLEEQRRAMTPAEGVAWLAAACGRTRCNADECGALHGQGRGVAGSKRHAARQVAELTCVIPSDALIPTSEEGLRRELDRARQEVERATENEEDASELLRPLEQVCEEMEMLINDARHALVSFGVPLLSIDGQRQGPTTLADGISWLANERAKQRRRSSGSALERSSARSSAPTTAVAPTPTPSSELQRLRPHGTVASNRDFQIGDLVTVSGGNEWWGYVYTLKSLEQCGDLNPIAELVQVEPREWSPQGASVPVNKLKRYTSPRQQSTASSFLSRMRPRSPNGTRAVGVADVRFVCLHFTHKHTTVSQVPSSRQKSSLLTHR